MIRERTHGVWEVKHRIRHERVHSVEIAVAVPAHAGEATVAHVHHVGTG